MNVIFARSEIDERLFISAFASTNQIYKMQQPREAKPGTSLPCCARTHVNAARRVPKIGKLLKNVKHRQNPSSIQATTRAHIRLLEGVSVNAVPGKCFRQKSEITFQNGTQTCQKAGRWMTQRSLPAVRFCESGLNPSSPPIAPSTRANRQDDSSR